MNIAKRVSALTAAIFVVSSFGAAPSFAQEPQPTQPPAAERPSATIIEGELIAVDTETMQIAVKTASGAEEQLRYNEETQVVGAQSGVAGLANSRNTMVSVRFTGSGPDRVATEIVVHEPQ